MYDEKRTSEEGSSASVQDVDRKGETSYAELETISSEIAKLPEQSGSSLPSGHYRQGYCSCCQVHYINLEKHLSSDQHRHLSSCKKNRFNNSMLMERFLQDVHLYHPQHYHDTRPTYDDIPEVDVLSSSQEDRFCIVSPPQTNNATVSSLLTTDLNKHCMFDSCISKYNSKEMAFSQTRNKKPEMEQCSTSEELQQSIPAFNSILTIGQESLSTAVNTMPHSSPCNPSPLFSPSQLTAKKIGCFETPHSILYLEPNKNKTTKHGKGIKSQCSNVTTSPTSAFTNRQCNFQGSCCNLTSGTSFGKESIFKCQEEKEVILRDCVLTNDLKRSGTTGESPNHLKDQGIRLFRGDKTSVDDVIEAVIWKYCHEPSSNRSPEKDEKGVSSLNVESIITYSEGSSLSFDWNVPTQLGEEYSKSLITNLDLLKESSVKIDEDYKSKLKCVLRVSPEKDLQAIKSEHKEDILPALTHVPPSFVGKTWSQIMYEDDLKVEALVKQFKKGKFHCYFEEEPQMNAGSKRHHKNKETERKSEVQTDDWNESQNVNVLPLFEDHLYEDHHSDTHSIKSETLLKSKHPKPCRRTWRQASRCQVVKVSHGTQTSLVNYPVIKKKVLKNESQQGVFDDFGEEMTPDMKTRMCALKLPESYTKILTPLQPKTMVYVLSHPDIKPSTFKAACISSRGRNRYSTDSRDSVYYKYKQSPLKYYDPLTNRILKTPPRNSVRGMGSKALCVRKLFRSLSSEGNVDKLEFEQKKSDTSKKSLSSCSVASVHTDSAKGKDLNSSTNGEGSSHCTDYIGTACVKSGHPDKPYAQFPLTPCNASYAQDKEDIQHSSMITQSKKTMRPKKMIRRESPKSSTRKTKPVLEPRVASQFKDNSQKMAKNLGKPAQGKSRCKKQPRRKSSSVLPKSTKPFVQVCRPSRKISASRRNERSVGGQKTLGKSQFVSLKPTKRKSSITKCVSNKNTQNSYQDKRLTRKRSKTSEIIVHNTIHQLRSRHITTTTASSTRTLTSRLTRRKVS
ncbi:DBF4-type zinc finger-containing protein 2 [Mixophyes fleayi]|uniref:DBF4-type zinc finger-containing protein 2 n=1 Tax=Mixophyes fleayi TaxID=3061075 RepID=UPI003F4E272B